MTVTYEIRFTVDPGQRHRFLDLIGSVLDAMRDEPMFHRAALHEDPEDDHRFLLIETWADHDAVVAVQLARPYRRAFHDALPEILAANREINIWRPLRSDDSGRNQRARPLVRKCHPRETTVVFRRAGRVLQAGGCFIRGAASTLLRLRAPGRGTRRLSR